MWLANATTGATQRAVHNAWAEVGEIHKRRIAAANINQPLVLRQARKRFNYKPDSTLVLLFWARQLIIWHYLCYWRGEEPHEKDIHREVCAKAA